MQIDTVKTNEAFPMHLDVREVGQGKWQLLSDYIYDDIEFGEIRVPKSFVSDFYSVPRIVRSIVSKVQDSNVRQSYTIGCIARNSAGQTDKGQPTRFSIGQCVTIGAPSHGGSVKR